MYSNPRHSVGQSMKFSALGTKIFAFTEDLVIAKKKMFWIIRPLKSKEFQLLRQQYRLRRGQYS
jgi:hypothetical protein